VVVALVAGILHTTQVEAVVLAGLEQARLFV
jgi:hypothetical protein